MAAITHADILTKKAAVHRTNTGAIVIISNPDATSDATANVFRVKDPRGESSLSAANARGGVLDGWKKYSYADLATAYGV